MRNRLLIAAVVSTFLPQWMLDAPEPTPKTRREQKDDAQRKAAEAKRQRRAEKRIAQQAKGKE